MMSASLAGVQPQANRKISERGTLMSANMRAMVIEGLDGAVRHRMYVAIYQNVLDGLQPRKREAVMTVIAAIDDTAIKFSGSPPIFGSMLAQVCLRGGGNLGTILGTAI